MTTPEDELLVEATASAWRPRDTGESVAFHPAWHDLGAADREAAFEVARRLRALEAALDPEGLSTTARAVLGRLRGHQRR